MQPGGKREPGEDALATLARELEEELGVAMEPDTARRLGEFEDAAVHETDHRVRAEVFEVAIHGQPAARAEIAELRWVDPAATDGTRIAPLSTHHILPRLLG